MPLNAVDNNAPAAAKATAGFSDSTVAELNQPAPKAPPGSIGHQLQPDPKSTGLGQSGRLSASASGSRRGLRHERLTVIQNLVLNNSAHDFSVQDDATRANFDQAKVVPTPGTDAAVNANLRSQLEAGTLKSSGTGINAEYQA